MASTGTRRRLLAFLGIAAAALVLAAVFLVGQDLAIRSWEQAFATEIRAALRVVGAHLGTHLDEVTQRLRQVGGECRAVPQGGAGWCAAELAAMQRQQPRMFRGGLVFGSDGAIVGGPPPGGWRGDELDVAVGACRHALAARSDAIAVTQTPAPRAWSLVVVVPVEGRTVGPAPTVAALGMLVDSEQLLGMLLRGLVPEGSGAAFLVNANGVLAAMFAGERTPLAADLAPGARVGDLGTAARQAWAGGGAGLFSVRADEASPALFGVAQPVAVMGEEWTIAAVWPRRAMIAPIRPLILLGMVGLALLVAGGVGFSAAWLRQHESRSAALRDAEWWRNLAERQEREGRWRGLADHCPAPVVCLRGSRIVNANLAAVEALGGTDRPGVVGRDLLDFIAPDDRHRVAALLDRALGDRPESDRRVVRFVGADGAPHGTELVATSSEVEGESLAYASWAEVGGLARAEARLEAVAAAVPSAVVLCDTGGGLVWANPAFAERTGHAGEAFRGRSLLTLVEPSDWRRMRAALGRARRGRASAGALRVRAKDGALIDARFKSAPISLAGEVLGVVFVADPTGGPGAAAEAVEVRHSRVISALGASLAHRLRNDLQALLGMLAEQRGVAGPADGIDTLRGLVGNAVEDLRRFAAISRTGAGSLQEAQLGDAVQRWMAQARAGLPGRVRATLRRTGSEDRVMLDAAQLALALDVALTASVAAMGEGGGAVEVWVGPGDERRTVRVRVEDTGESRSGPGRPGARVGRLLTTRETAAAVADLVARRHGGCAGSRTVPGVGCSVWIEIPLAPELPARREAGAIRRSGAVLIADDEEMVRSTLAAALREQGLEVVEAGDGAEAVAAVVGSPGRFALVALDLVMPVMDGREALRRLREAAPDLPVVICTGYDPADDAELVAAGLLIKPFTIEEFVAKVRGMLETAPSAVGGGDKIDQ